jgi:hypothetical protein
VRGVAASVSRRSEDLAGVCVGGAISGFVIAMLINVCVRPEAPSPYMLLGLPAGALFGFTVSLLPAAWEWARRSVGLRG